MGVAHDPSTRDGRASSRLCGLARCVFQHLLQRAAPLRSGRISGSRSGFRAHSQPKAHSAVVRCTQSRAAYLAFSTSSRLRKGVRSTEAAGGATRRCGSATRATPDLFLCGAGCCTARCEWALAIACGRRGSFACRRVAGTRHRDRSVSGAGAFARRKGGACDALTPVSSPQAGGVSSATFSSSTAGPSAGPWCSA
jgi:hypothetical protein